ncbi:hypothetical protein BDN70DRAFT_846899 [Pholiota conissans]|uniref:Protein prenylyltransferase n=1 Tax=Pholiota conissans TaxID=109636 RepID=A0A9P5ZG11_9AGAR|nr:hypothetical protein BDN70DRAFT_846899 [Pholiota conissans]
MSEWKDLVFLLSDLLQGQLASIEVLPGGLEEWEGIEVPPEAEKPSSRFPFVLVEGNLGIPKKVLYAVYMAAVNIPWRSSDARAANAATSIIILLNPAHQTALNHRKHLIRDGQLDAAKELLFTEHSARGSPEFGKQSMIWDHRRWCFGQIYGIIGSAVRVPYLMHWASSDEAQIFPRMNPSAIQHELDILEKTCEAYPRNYHGWSHWHLMINICFASIHLSEDSATKRRFFGIIEQAYTRLGSWVERHVGDYSAMHQRCLTQTLIEHLTRIELFTTDIANTNTLTVFALADHAESLVIAYPAHESVWMYLRVSMARLSPESRAEIRERVRNRSVSQRNFHLRLFEDWCSRPRGNTIHEEV